MISETSREPVASRGRFQSYFVYDEGFDDIGRAVPQQPDEESRIPRARAPVGAPALPPRRLAGRSSAPVRLGPTFLEQWFDREFDQGLPHDVTAYFKRQQDTEAFTLLAPGPAEQPRHHADLLQEQFEVERLPEIGYHRIGDSLLRRPG